MKVETRLRPVPRVRPALTRPTETTMYDFYANEEFEAEYNARFDYIAELRTEHAESDDCLAAEAADAEAGWRADWEDALGPWILEDDLQCREFHRILEENF